MHTHRKHTRTHTENIHTHTHNDKNTLRYLPGWNSPGAKLDLFFSEQTGSLKLIVSFPWMCWRNKNSWPQTFNVRRSQRRLKANLHLMIPRPLPVFFFYPLASELLNSQSTAEPRLCGLLNAAVWFLNDDLLHEHTPLAKRWRCLRCHPLQAAPLEGPHPPTRALRFLFADR